MPARSGRRPIISTTNEPCPNRHAWRFFFESGFVAEGATRGFLTSAMLVSLIPLHAGTIPFTVLTE